MRSFPWTMLILLAFPVALAAQLTPPATRPSVPADTLTPLGTMKLFQNARAAGDGATLKRLIQTTQPSEERFVAALGNDTTAQLSFRKAMAAKFPSESKKGEAAVADNLKELGSQIDQWDEQITGDTAAIHPAGTEPNFKIKLNRVHGDWLFEFDSMFSGNDNLDEVTNNMELRSGVMRGIADDIMSGKLTTLDDIDQAGQVRMAQATLAAQASTQPSGVANSSATKP